MSNITKTTLVNLLKEGTVSLKFTKADGSLRVMNATLDVEGFDAAAAAPTTAESASVFDTDKSEWRAFRWDSLKEINGTAVAGL